MKSSHSLSEVFIITEEFQFEKNDYIRYDYCGEILTGRILSVSSNTAIISVCLSNKRGEDNAFDEIEVKLSELKPLKVKIKKASSENDEE